MREDDEESDGEGDEACPPGFCVLVVLPLCHPSKPSANSVPSARARPGSARTHAGLPNRWPFLASGSGFGCASVLRLFAAESRQAERAVSLLIKVFG